jgi:TnpA family transposase
MPWRDLLSPTQRVQVVALPTSLREYEGLYTLTPADMDFVAAHRTHTNRLGVAVQLCFLRYPGRAWTPKEIAPAAMRRFIALQIGAEAVDLLGYAERDQTRREHLAELMREYRFTAFGVKDYRALSTWLTEQARGTDNGLALVRAHR